MDGLEWDSAGKCDYGKGQFAWVPETKVLGLTKKENNRQYEYFGYNHYSGCGGSSVSDCRRCREAEEKRKAGIPMQRKLCGLRDVRKLFFGKWQVMSKK